MSDQLRTTEIVQKVIENTDFKVVAVELKPVGSRKQLRVFLDSEKGISIEDCRVFSRQIESVLDEEKFLGEDYMLEVSSPGADRPISELWQFRKNTGRPVRVQYRSESGEEKEFVGTIVSADERIQLRHTGKRKDDVQELLLPMESVIEARIVLPW